jgi:hypothetical protein
MRLLELHRCGAQRELIVIQAPLHIAMRFHPIQIAFPFGTLHRVVINLQTGADRLKLVGGEGATAVGD